MTAAEFDHVRVQRMPVGSEAAALDTVGAFPLFSMSLTLQVTP